MTKLKAERLKNKQQLKSAAVKAWQSIIKEESWFSHWMTALKNPTKDSQQNIKNEYFIYDYVFVQ